MKKILMFVVAVLFVAGLSTTAKAVVLPFEGVGAGTEVTTLNGGVSTPFVGTAGVNPVFTGTLDETVYSDPTGYLFEYQFSNTTTAPLSSDTIGILTVYDFAGVSTSISNTSIAAGEVAPIAAYSGGDGDVNFDFLGLAPGQTSDVLLVQTNAHTTLPGLTLVQDHGQAQIASIGPAPLTGSATPEPATMAMFGMGTLGLFGLRKRKLVS